MTLSGYLIEEEWDAEASIAIEDEVYFAEDLTASDIVLSIEDEVEEEDELDITERFSI